MTEELTQSHMLAAIGVLCVLAGDEERDGLRVAAKVGRADARLSEASTARKWLERKLRTLDVSGLPDDFPRAVPVYVSLNCQIGSHPACTDARCRCSCHPDRPLPISANPVLS